MKRKSTTTSQKRRPPTIEALRTLAVLSETESISETARRLGVTQPVITKKLQIFKDKAACGAVLLRSDGHVTLTEAGRAIVPAVCEMVSRYDLIINYLQGEDTAPQVIRIGTGSFAAEHYLPNALAAVRNIAEDCKVETRVCRGQDRIVGTARGVFDISIVTHNQAQVRQIMRAEGLDESSLTLNALGRHTMCLLASPQTDAGRELVKLSPVRAVPPSKLKQWELVGPDSQSGIRRQLESRFSRGQLYFVAEGGGWAAAKEYARAGLGVAIVPLAVVRESEKKKLVCRKMAKEFDFEDRLLSRREDSSSFIQEIKDAIVSAAQSHQNKK